MHVRKKFAAYRVNLWCMIIMINSMAFSFSSPVVDRANWSAINRSARRQSRRFYRCLMGTGCCHCWFYLHWTKPHHFYSDATFGFGCWWKIASAHARIRGITVSVAYRAVETVQVGHTLVMRSLFILKCEHK